MAKYADPARSADGPGPNSADDTFFAHIFHTLCTHDDSSRHYFIAGKYLVSFVM